MKALVQRVSKARVTVEGQVTGQIGPGLLVLLAVGKSDTEADVDYLVEKVTGLRIFDDASGKMNHSLLDTGGGLLVVSQFTLFGETRKGRRPSFAAAGPPELARNLYNHFLVRAGQKHGLVVQAGVFKLKWKWN